ncbi:MAG: NAD(P)/FAD-dependent oxidoreductase, partial [Thermoanaerobaculia bacterium]|nr:NAD(P)/FAD-dependent oxidoreductase [Thermoanaerobaculia bacterium]
MPRGSTDVVVVGAGPVGLATAIGIASRGGSVRVIDRAGAPIDKACGEGIMPHGVEALERLGVDPLGCGGRPFRGIRYVDGARRVEGHFPARSGVAVRRTVLQRLLLDRAREAGAQVELGLVVRGLVRRGHTVRGVRTDAGERRARWIVGADGARSGLRRWSGLDRGSRGGRFGMRRHYAVAPWSDLVEVHWTDGCEAYVTPVGRGEIGVAMLWEGYKAGFDQHLARFPALAARLAGATVSSRDRGAGPLEQRVRAVAAGRVALVGDASGYIDAITG